MEDLNSQLRDLVVANRILAREEVVDAYGHVSVRHPQHPDRYLLSCSRSPELVTLDDIVEHTLAGDSVGNESRTLYAERHIHGGHFRAAPRRSGGDTQPLAACHTLRRHWHPLAPHLPHGSPDG